MFQSVMFAFGANDLFNLIIIILLAGGGAIAQLIKAAAEKNKQKNNAPPATENVRREAPTAQNVRRETPTPMRSRPPSRSPHSEILNAVLTEANSGQKQKKPLTSSLQTSTLTSHIAPETYSASSQKTQSMPTESVPLNLVGEIHRMLRDPQSIRQAIILNEILNRKEF